MYEGPDAQSIDSVFVLGNGPSRKNIDISKLDGTIIGCNACYRDFIPDVICAIDAGIRVILLTLDMMDNVILHIIHGICCPAKYMIL